MKVSIIIPAYNEAKTLEKIVEKILSASIPLEKETIIIDDGSTDGTGEIAEKLWLQGKVQRVLRHKENLGKGTAVREGCAQATGELILIQDADLEYNPNDYPKLLAPILRNEADVVFGSRFKSDSNQGAYFFNTLANYALTAVSNLFTKQNLSDVSACYKAFRVEVIRQIAIEESRFAIDVELVAKTAKLARLKNYKIIETGISYQGRKFEQGKKISWRDGFAVLKAIWKYR